MKYLLMILTALFLTGGYLSAQTCCSGGVPISGNIGFVSSTPGALQLELSYDYNFLNTLKNEQEVLSDNSRRRTTQSVLLKAGYSFKSGFSMEGLFSYVSQTREIVGEFGSTIDKTRGMGDAVLLLKYSKQFGQEFNLNVGVGPKLPLGAHNLKSENGIAYNADLQPGSGSWDYLSWGNVSRQISFRPTATVHGSVTYRLNGKNKEYFGTQEYRFGSSIQIQTGISDRFVVGKTMVDPSLSFRYRKAREDRIDGRILDNTGGEWIFFSPAIAVSRWQNIAFNITPEIPVYAKVTGTQLSPTLRVRVGVYYTFLKQSKININPGYDEKN